jgi:hypothetical protein
MPSRPGTRNRLKTTLPVRYGQDFVALLDRRCRLSRTVRDRLQALVDSLGGESGLSHQQMSMCKRAIWVELLVEDQESRVAAGEGVDGALHTQLVSSLLSLYRLLGVKRQAREASLTDYLKRGESTP